MASETDDSNPLNRAAVAVSLAMILAGVGALAGIAYADLTGEVTRAEYDEYAENCTELDGESRVVDGGLGAETVELGKTAVERCQNTTFAQYRQTKLESMWAAPISLKQWLFYGSFSVGIAALGAVVLRQELSR